MRTALLSVLFLCSAAASAQSRPVAAVVKVAVEPQFGVDARLGERVSLRALTAFATDFEDTSVVLNLAGFYRLSGLGRFGTRLGVSTTIVDFEDAALFGVLLGADYELSDRVGVFAEVALDADFGDGLGVLRSTNNTGVGLRVGL